MDIVKRLRNFGPEWTAEKTGLIVPYEICVAAIDEIERLRTALRRIRSLAPKNSEKAHIIAAEALSFEQKADSNG